MNKLTELDVIATREFELKGNRRMVVVRVGRPARTADGHDFHCPYEITGLDRERQSGAHGIDSVQALLLAMKKIGTDLYTSEEAKEGSLSWRAGVDGDLGFPVPASVADLLPPTATY